MKKLNKKGFLIAESIIVGVFVLSLFTFLFVNVVPLVGQYEAREKYDTINGAYNANLVRTMILEDNKMEQVLELNNLPYKIYEREDLCTVENLEKANYCTKLLGDAYLNVDKIYITWFRTEEIKKASRNNDIDFNRAARDYIDSLDGYKQPSGSTYDNYKRIIVQYNDGAFANIEVKISEVQEDAPAGGGGVGSSGDELGCILTAQPAAGTIKVNNNWYRSNVVIRFKSKGSTNGATISSFGIGTSETYNNQTTYTLTKDGTYVIKGYVKDSNGYTATCSINVKRDATKPNCALSVKSGTKADDGTYTSNITIGFKSKADATSGMNSFGIGKSTTYANNTIYTITTTGDHTVYGYVKDNAGNTNICSIKVTKKPQTYEYQYSKYFGATYSAWSGWTTKEYECSNPPSFKNTSTYEAQDLGPTKVISGYKYAVGKSITATQVKEVGKVTEKSCAGWTYWRHSTVTTKTYAIKVTDGWKYVGLVSLSAPPTDTLSTKYEFVGMDWERCGDTCTTTPYTTWKKYTRSVSTVTATDTITSGSNVSVTCSSYENKETVLYTTYSAIVGYEKTRTINYETVCSYKYRTRTVTKEAYTDYKWSYYNDQKLLNDGYTMTGNKRLTN